MRTFYFLFFLPFFLASQTLKIQKPIRMLALGDSYTIGESVPSSQRWPAQFRDSIVKRGFSTDTLAIIATTGWRTDDLINNIKNKNLAKHKFNLVSLLIGVNNQYQGKPFSQYKTEFIALVDSAIRYAGSKKEQVIIVSIPDYAYTPYGQSTSNPALISSELDQYNSYSKHIADSLGITYFDITPISRQGVLKPNYVAGDGLHPSGVQYGEWVRLMMQFVDTKVLATLKDQKKNEIVLSVYPNPVSDYLAVSGIVNKEVSFTIFDTNGQSVQTGTFVGETKLSISSLPNGVYFISTGKNEDFSVKRFVKI